MILLEDFGAMPDSQTGHMRRRGLDAGIHALSAAPSLEEDDGNAQPGGMWEHGWASGVPSGSTADASETESSTSGSEDGGGWAGGWAGVGVRGFPAWPGQQQLADLLLDIRSYLMSFSHPASLSLAREDNAFDDALETPQSIKGTPAAAEDDMANNNSLLEAAKAGAARPKRGGLGAAAKGRKIKVCVELMAWELVVGCALLWAACMATCLLAMQAAAQWVLPICAPP